MILSDLLNVLDESQLITIIYNNSNSSKEMYSGKYKCMPYVTVNGFFDCIVFDIYSIVNDSNLSEIKINIK